VDPGTDGTVPPVRAASAAAPAIAAPANTAAIASAPVFELELFDAPPGYLVIGVGCGAVSGRRISGSGENESCTPPTPECAILSLASTNVSESRPPSNDD
jgi:hypothetical protein